MEWIQDTEEHGPLLNKNPSELGPGSEPQDT